MSSSLSDAHRVSALGSLRLRWFASAAFSFLSLGLFYGWSRSWWSRSDALASLGIAGLALIYFLGMLWRSLDQNHRPGETQLLSRFGLGNWLTLSRALLISLLAGFLFMPRPEGWPAWIPGLLYTAASLPDYIDGYIARRSNHVTRLGETLDMNADSAGVLVAVLLAVQYGTIPWWYLPIGLARYLFLAGMWIRSRRNLPVYELPDSLRRKAFAALKMGFIFVVLFPVFDPPGTHVAAAAFGIPFALGFLWDWLLVSGRVRAQSWQRFRQLERLFLDQVPLLCRVLVVVLVYPQVQAHLQSAQIALVFLGAAEILTTLLLLLGVTGRLSAITALCLMGINQNLAPFVWGQHVLVVTYIAVLFLGTGQYSLWPFEERLIAGRPGES